MAGTAHLVVLGNGFDIDCHLPTQYGDFLDFVELLRDLLAVDNALWATAIDEWCAKKPRFRDGMKVLLNDAFDARSTTKDRIRAEWGSVVQGNAWVDHFTKSRSDRSEAIGENWVDFEAEIARIVSEIEHSLGRYGERASSLEDAIVLRPEDSRTLKLLDFYLQAGLRLNGAVGRRFDGSIGELHCTSTFFDLKRRLLEDLNGVRNGLQKYLCDFVERMEPEISPGIEALCEELAEAESRSVLSFNYTHTFARVFERMYKAESTAVNYCYLHGEVPDGVTASGAEPCNLVLGINERFAGEEVGQHLEFIEFRKYFQRVFYANDTRYLSWSEELADAASGGASIHMSLYGHSLAPTDSDVLTRFILTYGMKTTSYYHSRESFAQQIANMVALIGADELIARTGDNVRSLEFKSQVTI